MLNKIIPFFLSLSLLLNNHAYCNEATKEEIAQVSVSKRNKIIKASILAASIVLGAYLINFCTPETQNAAFNVLGIAGFSMTAFDFVMDDEADAKKTNNLLKEGKGLFKDLKPKTK